ncbi:translesion DNA synthesis-associated protein ImuA [Psychrosphaera algicola]|uniref:Translesion DNA synthesis-associated protein ImuA n=1 Tax=Psychrosphaera algicola TaxID=3023714 RepID=A0ABT5FG83_9GAMM|nr:translesion DNA synthesis-associated protein ImuA [Psychrosphaera sp. G1-22]MDC2890134.1 translesion DNA synthesis-associated protein ImuA [Psychrosphaera sp. G1-22]
MLEIDKYQNRGLIWYGNKNDQLVGRVKTGFVTLDNALSGGLPPQGVMEIKTPMGIGELRLMLPYLKQKQTLGLLVFIGPPAMLDAEFLAANDIDLSKVLVISEYESERMLWVAEQCLKSGSCGAVLLWQKTLSIKQSRRLLLASEQGESSLLLYRIMTHQQEQTGVFSIPSNVSMTLAPAPEGITVNIDKQRGGRSFKGLSVDMRDIWPDLTTSPISTTNVVAFPKVAVH